MGWVGLGKGTGVFFEPVPPVTVCDHGVGWGCGIGISNKVANTIHWEKKAPQDPTLLYVASLMNVCVLIALISRGQEDDEA